MFKNDAALGVLDLSGDESLLDAALVQFELGGKTLPSYQPNDCYATLRFETRHTSAHKHLKICLRQVSMCDVTFDSEVLPLYVTDYKLLKDSRGRYYLSLDPDPATLLSAGVAVLAPSETDRFTFAALELEVEFEG